MQIPPEARCLLAAIAAATIHLQAAAIEVAPGLEVHGYGDAGFLRETVSPQSSIKSDHDLSLLGTFQVIEGGRVWAQLAHLSATDRVRLDLLFFDFEINAGTTIRIGQARLPTGIYNETRDVQSLRASASLPLLYAGDPVAIDKALRGLTLDRRFGTTALGAFEVEAFAAWGVVPDGEDAERARLAGGRLTWVTPVDGLTLKLSGYSGHLRGRPGAEPEARRTGLREFCPLRSRPMDAYCRGGHFARRRPFLPSELRSDRSPAGSGMARICSCGIRA